MLDDNDRLYPPHAPNGHDDNVPTPVPTHNAPGADTSPRPPSFTSGFRAIRW